METVDGILGRLGRQCYAVLCLGVLLVSVTIAHYYVGSDVLEQPITTNHRQSTQRRLRVLRGHPLRTSSLNNSHSSS